MDIYSVEKPLSPEAWNALDEGERMLLVEEDHRRTGSATGGRPEAHAAIHVVVENRLADGDPAVTRAYERFRAAGASRHNTVHALMSVVTNHMVTLLEEQRLFDPAMDQDFDTLDPAAFMKRQRTR